MDGPTSTAPISSAGPASSGSWRSRSIKPTVVALANASHARSDSTSPSLQRAGLTATEDSGTNDKTFAQTTPPYNSDQEEAPFDVSSSSASSFSAEPHTHDSSEDLADDQTETQFSNVPSRTTVKEDNIVNREIKLTLLIGFLAIVVVGVLVTEHFSKARSAVRANNLGTSSPVTFDLGSTSSDPLAPISAQYQRPASDQSVETIAMISGGDVNSPARTQDRAANGADAPRQPSNSSEAEGFSDGPIVVPNVPPAASQTAGEQFEAINPVPDEGPNDSPNSFETAPRSTPAPARATNDPAASNPNIFTPGDADRTPSNAPTPSTRKPVSQGREQMHPVQRGETLAKLARTYYNDASLANDLRTYNTSRVGKDGTLRIGVTLRIPPKDVLLGQAVLTDAQRGTGNSSNSGSAGSANANTRDAARTPAAPASTSTYTVKRGDTLGHIAQRTLGTTKRVGEILKANPGLTAETLKVGAVLKIPAR